MTLSAPVVLDILQHFVECWNETKKHTKAEIVLLALPHNVAAPLNAAYVWTQDIHTARHDTRQGTGMNRVGSSPRFSSSLRTPPFAGTDIKLIEEAENFT
ncbi:hypothetical protein C8R46DRAFT_1236787 [Mycena filopes]|nr:hypothetical protein C8R46DRAFT_1236787 [Mycena filopes]